MNIPRMLFSHSTWAYAISHYLINKALDGAFYLPIIVLLGTVTLQASILQVLYRARIAWQHS